jgi:hypothetical protein
MGPESDRGGPVKVLGSDLGVGLRGSGIDWSKSWGSGRLGTRTYGSGKGGPVLLVQELGSGSWYSDLLVWFGGPKTVTRTYRSGSEVRSLVHKYSRRSGKRLTEYPRVVSGYFAAKEDDLSKQYLDARLSRLWPAQ